MGSSPAGRAKDDHRRSRPMNGLRSAGTPGNLGDLPIPHDDALHEQLDELAADCAGVALSIACGHRDGDLASDGRTGPAGYRSPGGRRSLPLRAPRDRGDVIAVSPSRPNRERLPRFAPRWVSSRFRCWSAQPRLRGAQATSGGPPGRPRLTSSWQDPGSERIEDRPLPHPLGPRPHAESQVMEVAVVVGLHPALVRDAAGHVSVQPSGLADWRGSPRSRDPHSPQNAFPARRYMRGGPSWAY